jgi:DNA-binding transcriptional LysR family regulator
MISPTMRRRHEHTNIPTELLRTAATIAEVGSFTETGKRLRLSQPTISAQMKRLQMLVGGAVFEKAAGGGLAITPKGRVVLALARKLLDANDRLLALGGIVKHTQLLRVGVTMLYAEHLLASLSQKALLDRMQVTCAFSGELAKLLADGTLDVACVVDGPTDPGDAVLSWDEEFVWVCGKEFKLQPGHPLPVVACEGVLGDRMIRALESAGLLFSIAFNSSDHGARIVATAAGMGIMSMPARHVRDPLKLATQYFLPAIQPMRVWVLVRPGVESERAAQLLDVLRTLAPPEKGKMSNRAGK